MIGLNTRVALLYPFYGKAKAILSIEDLKLLDKIQRIRTTTSKKEPEVRRKELISSLSRPLLSLIESHAKGPISTSFRCQFITEVLLGSREGREPAISAVLALVDDTETEQILLNDSAPGRILKTLVQGGRFSPKTSSIDLVNPPLNFHEMFYQRTRSEIVRWATSRSSFVVVSLLEVPGFAKADEIHETLSQPQHRQKLLNAAKGDPAVVKVGSSKANRKSQVNATGVLRGNRGFEVLLEKLDAAQ